MPVLKRIDNRDVWFPEPAAPPPCPRFVKRDRELALCRAAWACTQDGRAFEKERTPLHFRLEGPPGVGKNEIVYELARQLGKPVFMMQGHEEFSPEDLALVLVPGDRQFEFRLQASPLAAALFSGGLCFFDEINRVPPRALSPLASVLDSRRTLDSAMAGMSIKPDDGMGAEFRFCCAMNPGSDSVTSRLPQYIDERTLPVIKVGFPSAEELFEIVQSHLSPPRPLWEAFEEWYGEQKRKEISTRQAISLLRFALNALAAGEPEHSAIATAAAGVFREEGEKTE